MNRALKKQLRAWLDLERRGREEEAEVALRALFARLPAVRVPSGLADRVLKQAGLSASARTGRAARGRLGPIQQGILGLSLVLAAAAGAFLVPVALPVLARLRPGLVLEVAVAGVVGLGQRLAEGFAVWQALSKVTSMLAESMSSPEVMAALAFGSLISITALHALSRMIVPERSSSHV